MIGHKKRETFQNFQKLFKKHFRRLFKIVSKDFLKMFQKCFKNVSKCFKNVLNFFKKCFKRFSKLFRKYFKPAPRVFQNCSKSIPKCFISFPWELVLRMFRVCFKSISRTSHWCFMVFQVSFKGVLLVSAETEVDWKCKDFWEIGHSNWGYVVRISN